MSPRASAGLSTAAAPRPPCVSPGRLEEMDLVEEKHDPRLRRLPHQLLDAFLELTAVLRARDDRRQRHSISRVSFSASGTLPAAIRWARPSTIAVLPTPGGSEEHWVALGRAQQRLDDPRRLFLAADDRRQQPVARQLGQVTPDPIEQRRRRRGLLDPRRQWVVSVRRPC